MSDKVCIIVSSGDSRVIKTALQYARRTMTESFMKDTKLFLFGPSEEIIALDTELQDFVRMFMDETDKEVMACKWCSDDYDVSEKLRELGIKVDFIGVYVSEAIREGYVPMVW